MSELTEEGRAILKEALERQARDWLEEASELAIATRVVFREMMKPPAHLDKPLTPAQLAQRKQILGIAHAVLEASCLRALENAIGSLTQKDPHESTRATVSVGGGSPEAIEGGLQEAVSGSISDASSHSSSNQEGPQ